MRDFLLHSAIAILVAAGLFLSLPMQGASARGSWSGVTAKVNSSFQPAHRMIKQRFGPHRKLSGHVHGGRRHSAQGGFHQPSRNPSGKVISGYPGTPAASRKPFGPAIHPGGVLIILSEEAKQSAIVPPFSGVVTRSVEAGGIVVFRGPAVSAFGREKTPAGSGGKLILISP